VKEREEIKEQEERENDLCLCVVKECEERIKLKDKCD
jgi:hypothetical protein